MTGTLAQLVSLVSFGNEFLDTGILPDHFYPDNSTFQFCNRVDFVTFKKAFFFTKFKEAKFADDPYRWFELLKKDKCRKLSLFYEDSKDQINGPDHKLAGFVGGGGTWSIEAIYKKHSDYWVNNWTVTNKDAEDHKIWSVKYGATSWDQPTRNVQFDLPEVKNELNESLTNIGAFAGKQQLESWANIFERAKKALESDDPIADFYHKDLIVIKNYPLIAQQVLFTAGLAWVFGGMGSWNDLGFEKDEDNKTYDELSATLYNNINMGIIAAVNYEPESGNFS